ncbi:unnamed protein product, partial [Symbiodinium sp. CCMP2456]
DMLDDVFAQANERRARAINKMMPPHPDATPCKPSSMRKRTQKSTPVDMTPTPTPGAKHHKQVQQQSPAAVTGDTPVLKQKLSFSDESTTDAPAGSTTASVNSSTASCAGSLGSLAGN